MRFNPYSNVFLRSDENLWSLFISTIDWSNNVYGVKYIFLFLSWECNAACIVAEY